MLASRHAVENSATSRGRPGQRQRPVPAAALRAQEKLATAGGEALHLDVGGAAEKLDFPGGNLTTGKKRRMCGEHLAGGDGSGRCDDVAGLVGEDQRVETGIEPGEVELETESGQRVVAAARAAVGMGLAVHGLSRRSLLDLRPAGQISVFA
jgi:hypothetical protein